MIGVLKAAGKNADKLTMRLRQTFAWAIGYGFIDQNPVPVNGELKAVMDTRRETKHHKALDWRKVPEFLAALPYNAAGQCCRLLILLGLRSNEARNLRWSDLNLDAGLLVIPAERMKSRREFRQPLTTAAQTVLGSMRRKGDLVFASERTGRALAEESLRRLSMRSDATTHGFRSSFSTWAAENGQDETATEHCLHHLTGSAVSRAYCRSEYVDRRHKVLDAWSAFVLGA